MVEVARVEFALSLLDYYHCVTDLGGRGGLGEICFVVACWGRRLGRA